MEINELEWVGSECGHHAAYTFYKGLKYSITTLGGPNPNVQKWKVLGIGQFLFVRIWGESDMVSVAEVQLLWDDKSTGQKMCSIRLYFLPEFTSDGRLPHHGEDEMVAVAEKAVLRVVDLLDWVVPAYNLNWERGAKSVAARDCPEQPDLTSDKTKLDLSEVDQAREDLGDNDIEEKGILILSASNYYRYRALLKRLEGVEDEWMKNNLITALGGFTAYTRNTSIMFAKEIFDYPELEEHPQLSNHLAPKMKGRPRKKLTARTSTSNNNQEEDSMSPPDSDPNTDQSANNCDKVSNGRDSYRDRRKQEEILATLAASSSPQETEFLINLTRFMDERGTAIEKPPMIGLKQIDLYSLYNLVLDQGGYDSCMANKSWKAVFDQLEGPANSGNSAGASATHTRRHYERYLLPYERHMMKKSTNNRKSSDVFYATGDKTPPDKSGGGTDRKPEITLDENSGLQLTDGKPDPDAIKSDLNNKDEKDGKGENNIESSKPKLATKQYLGIKPLQLLTEPKESSPDPGLPGHLAANASLDLSKLILPGLGGSLDPAGAAGVGGVLDDPTTGSALQNLAKIASRYSKDKSRTQEFLSPGSKRQRLTDSGGAPGIVQPLPATPSTSPSAAAINNSLAAAAVAMAGMGGLGGGSTTDGGITASALLQQFSLMSPLLSGLTGNSATSQEGYNLLKYYEQQLKLLQGSSSSVAAGGSSGSSHGSTPPPTALQSPLSVSSKKDAPSPLSSHRLDKKDSDSANKLGKEKNKVNKPPPDTVKPPRLLQNPCQFLQTSTIYGSPKSDLDKVKEYALRTLGSGLGPANNGSSGLGSGGQQSTNQSSGNVQIHPNQVLDLSSGCMEYRTVSPHHRSSLSNLSSTGTPPPLTSPSTARLSHAGSTRTTTSSSSGAAISMDNGIDLRMNSSSSRTSTPSGAKNFSAEALIGISSNSSSNSNNHSSQKLSSLQGPGSPQKRGSSSNSNWQPQHSSSNSPGVSRNSTPVHALATSQPSSYSPRSSPAANSMRSSPSAAAAALQQQYQQLSAAASASTSAASANAAYLQALMMNPKAAAAMAGGSGSSSSSSSSAAASYAAMAAALGGSSSGQRSSGMDPLMSQYYAMLQYSQQLAAAAAYNPYAAAAALGGFPLPPAVTTSASSLMSSNNRSSASNSAMYNQLSFAAAGNNSASSALSFPGLFGGGDSRSGGLSLSSTASTASLINALSFSSPGASAGSNSLSSAAAAAANHQNSAALAAAASLGLHPSLAGGFSGFPSSSVPVSGSSSSLAAAMAAMGGSSSSSLAALAASSGLSSSQLAALMAGGIPSSSSSSAAAASSLASLTGSSSSSSLAALAAAGGSSSSLAALAAAGGGTFGGSSGLSMVPVSIGGGGSLSSATELQMYQAYQDLLARSGAGSFPPSSTASMFNMAGLLGGPQLPPNLGGQRKE